MGTLRQRFIGEGERYKYSDMCIPTVPWSKGEKKKLNFYTKGELRNEALRFGFLVCVASFSQTDKCASLLRILIAMLTTEEKLPILLSAVLGLQHAMSMVGGIITVPYVIFRFSVCFECVKLQQYGISAALITSGKCPLGIDDIMR